MCFALSAATAGFGIVAADTRTRYTPPGGDPVMLDWGGKIARARNGWATGVSRGSVFMLRNALESLASVDMARRSEVLRALALSHPCALEEARQWPDAQDPSAHLFTARRSAVSGYEVEIIRTDGKSVRGPGRGFLMNWPPEVDSQEPAAKRLHLSVNREIERAPRSPVGLARRIAEMFAYCDARAASVSPEIEAGFMGEITGYLRAPAVDLLDWSDAQIVEHVRANDGSETVRRLAAAQASYHRWKHQLTEV